MTTAEDGRVDQVTRTLEASPEAIYGAFRDGDVLMQWLPPSGMSGKVLEYDFRVGGRYRFELRYERDGGHGKTDSNTDVSKGEFLQLVPGETIQQSVEFESDDPELARVMTMTWTFARRGDATEVTVRADHVPSSIGRDDHLAGIAASLENLSRHVLRGA
ncbi:MAG: SRPBCC domain-containing protein [Deltaproteobacteria bacterium]|nr:SRPBCC domain-containing protein [Deltaproteobacteria bacterium]